MPLLTRTAEFRNDLNDPINREAEERFRGYCERWGWPVRDCRPQRTVYDFEVAVTRGLTYRIDVKADTYVDDTARVPFEDRKVFTDGGEVAGWGHSTELDILALVGITTWRCVFVRMREFRELVLREASCDLLPSDWIPIRIENTRDGLPWQTTHGWAVPVGELWSARALWRIDFLPTVYGETGVI